MKHYLPRRVIALALSIAMVLSMMCTAFATETETADTDPFDFSAEIAAQEAEESDTTEEADATSDAASSEESSTESEAESSEEDTDAANSASSVSAAVASSEEETDDAPSVSSASNAAAVSEDEATDAASEEADSTEAVASGDDASGAVAVSEEAVTAVQSVSSYISNGTIYVAGKAYTGYYLSTDSTMYSSSASDGYSAYSGLLTGGTEYFSAEAGKTEYSASLIYKDGKLYDGFYMNAGGKMYTVKSGVYSLYTGALASGTEYYKDGTGTATLSVGLVYDSGMIYTGYYMTTDETMFYADTSGYSKFSGFVPGGSEYIDASNKQKGYSPSHIYKDGKLHNGYYMNTSGKMYTVTSGVYSLYTGVLASGTQYLKEGSGMLKLSVGLVYYSGVIYTGYYMTNDKTMFYANTSGYSKFSGFVSGNSTYLAASDKQEHKCASRIYKDGKLHNGYYMNAGGKMYTVKSGVYSLYTGALASGTQYLKEDSGTLTLTVKQVYISGKVYAGYYMSGGYMYYSNGASGIALYTGMMTATSYLSASDMKTYSCSSLVYVSGVTYTGYFMSSDNLMYTVSSGVYSKYTGTLSSGTKYYKAGSGYVTLSEAVAYKSGVAQTNGWKFSNNYAYYYVGGTKVTGWYYITRNGSKYKYYFDPSDGHLVTNLYAYFGSSYKYKKCKLVLNLNTRNASILGYDSSTGTYCIPYYSFIIGISKTGKGPQAGNTYALSSNVQKKWFTFADNGRDYYYAYATLISGSGGYIHSERYSTNGDLNTLVTSTYNGLGTKQSSMCIRAQLYVAKLVYDVRQSYSGSIKVQVVSNSTYGPFGKITLSSTTGKVSSSTKSDPTGVSSYKGYIKQTAV